LIIILEKDKITEHVKHKLLRKGLSLVGMSDKEIIFNKLKHQFHWTFCYIVPGQSISKNTNIRKFKRQLIKD